MPLTNKSTAPPQIIPKITGIDVELASIDPLRDDRGVSSCRALLAKVDGLPAGYRANWAQDSRRIFLPRTGGSTYIDMDHWEWASPETWSAWQTATSFHAMLELARDAGRLANQDRDNPHRIRVHANNSDGHSNSWGGHQSFLLSRRAYSWLFQERLHHLLFLTSAQISSLILTGAGKVGSENAAPEVDYQISQRADFFECLVAERTTFRRPIVNCRDESLAEERAFARLHCIFHDTALCHSAIVLRTGFMQLILAMIERGRTNQELVFEDPLRTIRKFSHDTTLQTTAPLVSGLQVSAIEHQMLLWEEAVKLVDSGAVADAVPRAKEILTLWEEILQLLAADDRSALAGRIDWVGKQLLLENAISRHQLEWSSPEVKQLDHQWSDLEGGLYRMLERNGAIERLATPGEIQDAKRNAPGDTRAYLRAFLLQRFAPDVRAIDWDSIVLWRRGGRYKVDLPDPAHGSKGLVDQLRSLDDDTLLNTLGAHPAPLTYQTTYQRTTVTHQS